MLGFKSPKNYNELLPKLNRSTFFTTLIFFIMLRIFNFVPLIKISKDHIPPIDNYKEIIEWILSFGVIPIIAAFIALFFSSCFEMHNKISKWLRIRFLWAKFFIVKPLSQKAGIEIELSSKNVTKIMIELYYPEVIKINQHYVELFWRYALLFWVLFEHAIVVFISVSVLTVINRNSTILFLWGYFLIILIIDALQLIFVTAQKSTNQANQIPVDTVINYFNKNFSKK